MLDTFNQALRGWLTEISRTQTRGAGGQTFTKRTTTSAILQKWQTYWRHWRWRMQTTVQVYTGQHWPTVRTDRTQTSTTDETKPCLDTATMYMPGSKVLCHRGIPPDCTRFCRRRHCHGVKGGYVSDRLPLRLKRPSNTIPYDWPTQAIDGFHVIAGFQSVISAVDGTHIRIIAPHSDEENYVNRKHYHSINVQALCNHRGKSHWFINVNGVILICILYNI